VGFAHPLQVVKLKYWKGARNLIVRNNFWVFCEAAKHNPTISGAD